MPELTPLQTALARLMSDISEELYCASWLIDIEYDLWAMIKGHDRAYGLGTVPESMIHALAELSRLIGGWIIWRNDHEEYIPMSEWEELYIEHEEAQTCTT